MHINILKYYYNLVVSPIRDDRKYDIFKKQQLANIYDV